MTPGDIVRNGVSLDEIVGKSPVDFGVSMNDFTFSHKKEDGICKEDSNVYWEFSRGVPKGIVKGSKMWVANHGRWKGYFIIFEVGVHEVDFCSESFVEKDGGERKPFMGYTLKVPDLKEIKE